MFFADRTDAGRSLARELQKYQLDDPVVLGFVRGGLPVAAEVAAGLGAPLDVLVVRKLGAPFQPELAMGAVAAGALWLNEPLIARLGISREEVDQTIAAETAEVARQEAAYRDGRPPLSVEGRTVILVDDGLATGATAVAGIQALRLRQPRRIVFASPICSFEGSSEVARVADAVVCGRTPANFHAVSQAYLAFPQISDEAVRDLLKAGVRTS